MEFVFVSHTFEHNVKAPGRSRSAKKYERCRVVCNLLPSKGEISALSQSNYRESSMSAWKIIFKFVKGVTRGAARATREYVQSLSALRHDHLNCVSNNYAYRLWSHCSPATVKNKRLIGREACRRLWRWQAVSTWCLQVISSATRSRVEIGDAGP